MALGRWDSWYTFISIPSDVTTGEVTESYKKGQDTMLKDGYNATIYEGVLRASGSVAPYGVTAGKDKLNINAEYVDGDLIRDNQGNAVKQAYTLNCATDYTSLIGEYTKVVYSNKDKTTLGVFSVEEETTVVVETNRGDVGVIEANDVDVKIGDATYDFSAAVGTTGDPDVYVAGSAVWTSANSGLSDNSAFGYDNRNDDYVKMVDNNGDGKIDVVFIVPATLETVNYVGTDTMTLTTLGSVKKADMNLADDSYAVSDKVLITPKSATFNGNYGIEKATVVEGEVKAVRTATVGAVQSVVTSVQVNGTWYDLAATSTAADLATNGSVIKDDNGNALALNNTYKLYVRGNYAYAADIVLAGASSIGVITGVTSNTDFDGNTLLRMIKSDGTTVEAYMDWAGNYAPNAGSGAAFADGQIVAYTVSDDIYTLYPLGNTSGTASEDIKAKAGFDNFVGVGSSASSATDNPIATGAAFTAASGNTPAYIAGNAKYRINDNAVIFVQYDSNTGKDGLQSAWKVMSGKDVNAWKTNYGAKAAGAYMNTGLGYMDVVVITAQANAALPGSSSQYAYVTSDIAKSDNYVTYSIFDGTSETSVEVTEKVSTTNATKGAVISFDWDGDGVIKNVNVVSNTGSLTYTNGNQVKISGVGYDLADDVVVLNVDTGDKVGVPGKAITKAQMTTKQDEFYQNVTYKLNSDGEIEVLVVDIDGHWDGVDGTYYEKGAMTISDVNALFDGNTTTNVAITGDFSIGSSDLSNLSANETLTINGNVTLSDNVNISGNLVVNGNMSSNGDQTISGDGKMTVSGALTVAEDKDFNVSNGGTLEIGSLNSAVAGNIFATGDSKLIVADKMYLGGTDAIFSAGNDVEIHLTGTKLAVRQKDKGHMDSGDGKTATLQNTLDLSAAGIDLLVVTNNITLQLNKGASLLFNTGDTLQFNVTGCSISNIGANGAVTNLGGATVTSNKITSTNWESYVATGSAVLTGK